MEYQALGGIKEHGKNCFLIRGKEKQFLLDCGIGEKGEMPDFDKIEISKLNYLFLSHSHLDHSGAIKELTAKGFKGIIYCSKPTYDCLTYKYENVEFLIPNEIKKIDDLTILPRRSGHCFGSLSFEIQFEDKRIVYTGDYLENNVFKCDELRNIKADIAIVDSAYLNEKSYEENIKAFISLIKNLNGTKILPLPKNGRNIDVISILNDENIPYRLENAKFFIKEENVYLKNKIEIREDKNADVILIEDPQLENIKSRKIVDHYIDTNIIFTGTIDENSYADYLFKYRNHCYFSRINVHQNKKEADELVGKNNFKNTIYFHSKEIDDKKYFEF